MTFLTKIIDYFKYQRFVKHQIKSAKNHIRYEMKADYLNHCTLTSTQSGISAEKYCDHEIVVSLTTFGKRIKDVSATIESIMQGTMLPNRIILNIDSSFRNVKLPILLQKQIDRGLEINYCTDIRSYTKLIPTLKKYPEAAIITIDDDLIYCCDLIENLFTTYTESPNCICANRIHRVILGRNNMPLNYRQWQWYANPQEASPLNFLTGVGGVLYPPHAFNEEVFNEKVFLDICKYADDIWFYAMALYNRTMTIKSFTHSARGEDYIVNDSVQDTALSNMNTHGENLNDKQFKAVFDRYNLYPNLIK